MRSLAAAFLVVLVLSPAALAQNPPTGHVSYCSKECLPGQVNDDNLTNAPTQIILYAHLMDVLQRAPLNTVPPDLAREPDVNQGYLPPTVRVRQEVVNFQNNYFTMYHLPAFVDYDPHANNQDGPPAYPVRLGGTQAKAYWYLSPHAVPQMNSTTSPVGPVGVMPQMTIHARLETGRHAGHGKLIAEGASLAPVVLALPGNDYAYEFEIPLRIKHDTIPATDGFVFSLQWYQVREGEEEVSQSDWRIRSGVRFPNRLILPVVEPVRLISHTSLLRDGHHYLVTELGSAFGAYDLDPYSLNMTYVSGPTIVGNPHPLFFVLNPLKPQTVRVVWSVPSERSLRAGSYAFDLEVTNLQHTFRLHDQVTLDILDIAGPARADAPGPGALGAIAIAFVLAMARRRQ